MSKSHDIPMIVKRSAAKNHGTKRLIEGIYKENEKALIVEDVVTSGLSIVETLQSLNEAGIKVKDIITCIDRQQNGSQNLAKHGVKLYQ